MSRVGSLSRLSIAFVTVLVVFATTAVYAAAAGGGPANGAPRALVTVSPPPPSPTPTPTSFPSPSPTPTPFPSPSPTPLPSPSPTPFGACAPPPPATPTGPTSTQDAIEQVGGEIVDLVEQNGYLGFTGLIPDPDHMAMVVCWLRGDPLPSSIANIVANPGVPLTLSRQDAPFSKAQLDPRADALLGNQNIGQQIAGDLHSVTVPEEGSGLIASVQPSDPGTFNQTAAEQTLSAAAGVPVTIVQEPPDEATARKNDNSPWKGGARLTSGATSCSSGFGIVIGNTQALLTAAHCFAINAAVSNGGNAIGNVATRFSGTAAPPGGPDSEAIAINAPGQASGKVYVGGVADATEGTIQVTQVGTTLVNQFVNTSGSFSGENDQLRVTRTNIRVRVGDGAGGVFFVQPVSQAVATVNKMGVLVAVAAGDSGGPVIRRHIGQPVSGMGTIISGGLGAIPCMVYDARTCYRRVTFNSLRLLIGPRSAYYRGANLSEL